MDIYAQIRFKLLELLPDSTATYAEGIAQYLSGMKRTIGKKL
ncbi:hypothetical protein IBA8401_02860 [Pseudomonas syringae]